DDQGDLLPVQDPEVKVVVEKIQHDLGGARETGLGVAGTVEAVVAGERAAEVLLTLGAGEADAASAVVGQEEIAAAEQGRVEKRAEREEPRRSSRRPRDEVADVAVNHE